MVHNKEDYLKTLIGVIYRGLERKDYISLRVAPNLEGDPDQLVLTEPQAQAIVNALWDTGRSGVIVRLIKQGFGYGELYIKKFKKEGNYIGY